MNNGYNALSRIDTDKLNPPRNIKMIDLDKPKSALLDPNPIDIVSTPIKQGVSFWQILGWLFVLTAIGSALVLASGASTLSLHLLTRPTPNDTRIENCALGELCISQTVRFGRIYITINGVETDVGAAISTLNAFIESNGTVSLNFTQFLQTSQEWITINTFVNQLSLNTVNLLYNITLTRQEMIIIQANITTLFAQSTTNTEQIEINRLRIADLYVRYNILETRLNASIAQYTSLYDTVASLGTTLSTHLTAYTIYKGDVSAEFARLNATDTELRGLINLISGSNDTIAQLTALYNLLSTFNITELATITTARFAAIVGTIDGLIINLNTNFTLIANQFTMVANQFTAVVGRIDGVETRLNTTISSIANQFTAVVGEINALKARPNATSSSSNITASTTLTTGKIVVASGPSSVTTSQTSFGSSNEIITPLYGFTDIFSNTSYPFTWNSEITPPTEWEIGMKLTTSVSITVNAFRYRAIPIQIATGNVIRLWNANTGIILATAVLPESNSVDGWITSGSLNTGPLTLPIGSYILSHTTVLRDGPNYGSTNTCPVDLPLTINTITLEYATYNTSGGGLFPSAPSGNCVEGLDLVWYQTYMYTHTLTFPEVVAQDVTHTLQSTSGTLAHTSQIPQNTVTGATSSVRTLFGSYDPTNGVSVSLISGGYGISSVSFIAQGRYQLNYATAFTELPSAHIEFADETVPGLPLPQKSFYDRTLSSIKVSLVFVDVTFIDKKFMVTITGV